MTYDFTSDWFTPKLGPWEEHVVPRYRGSSSQKWIDVGSYEGRSALWVLDNLLGPLGQVYCVDVFDDYLPGLEWWGARGYPARFDKNTAAAQEDHRVVKCRGLTHEVLASLDRVVFDGAYLDGDHLESSVERDLALLWPKLRKGAVLVCDDYGCEDQPGARRAVDSFLAARRGEYELLHSGFQAILLKLVDPPVLRRPPVFTKDFFASLDRPYTWMEHVVPRVRDLQAARWLEVGSYEGQSARWTLDHVLRRPGDVLTCVDFFDREAPGVDEWGGNREYERSFDENVGAASNVVKVEGRGEDVLARMSRDAMTFHGAYLDGDHSYRSVKECCAQAWRMLLPRGVLVVDDYGSEADPGARPAVDELVAGWGDTCSVLHRGYQVILFKRR